MEKNYVIKHKICKGLSHLDHFTQPKLKSHIKSCINKYWLNKLLSI